MRRHPQQPTARDRIHAIAAGLFREAGTPALYPFPISSEPYTAHAQYHAAGKGRVPCHDSSVNDVRITIRPGEKCTAYPARTPELGTLAQTSSLYHGQTPRRKRNHRLSGHCANTRNSTNPILFASANAAYPTGLPVCPDKDRNRRPGRRQAGHGPAEYAHANAGGEPIAHALGAHPPASRVALSFTPAAEAACGCEQHGDRSDADRASPLRRGEADGFRCAAIAGCAAYPCRA